MATNFIDALLRHRQSSIPELVDVLRDIHHGKTANSQPPPALSAHLDGPESQLPLLIRRLILDGLARGSEDLARLIKPALDAPTGSEDGAARQYSALRDRFDRLERNVRQHAVTVDRLLNPDSPPPGMPASAAPYQETLYLQCARGGRTAGRFRCMNRRNRRTSVTSALRPFRMNGLPQAAAPMLTIRPGSFALDAGASEIIAVEVDLGPCPDLVDSNLQTSIDLHMNDAVALKIWIEIHVYERC
jgi:hypothetical protein